MVNQMESNMRQTQLCHQTGRRIAHTGQLIALLAAGLIISPGRAGEPPGDWAGGLPSLDDARFGEPALLKSGLARSLIDDAMKVEPAPPGAEFRAVRMETTRGVELASLYRKAAPGVVLILVEGGFGSAFVINKEGWLLTNHHVARGGNLREDLSREVTVMFGKFSDQGSMEPLPEKYQAQVYKWDQARDLALLKLKAIPAWAAQTELPVIRVAEKGVSPGDDVAAIGNAGVTLLWSMKPGVVQGVGRRLADLAGDFARRELRAEQAANVLVGAQPSEIEKELERQLQPMRNVLVIQATCPILHGDSGGPLLELAEGRAVGITSYGNQEVLGAAHFFIHASEIRDFLKDVPARPVQALPSFWETAATQCRIVDLDTNGQPETIILSRTVLSPGGLRTNILVGLGWDLAESSDLNPFRRKTPSGTVLDEAAVIRGNAMHLQMYLIDDNSTRVCAYDLDNSGHYGLVRLGLNRSGSCESELYSDGPRQPYQVRKLAAKQPVVLPLDRIPEAWRARYEKVVIGMFKARRAS
jgi:S1-C subfamily serine protease